MYIYVLCSFVEGGGANDIRMIYIYTFMEEESANGVCVYMIFI